MKVYDVSLLLTEDLPLWPGDTGISMKLSSRLNNRGDSCNVTHLEMGVHTGTHIDAPFHFEPEGVGVDQLPLNVLIGPCRLFEMNDLRESIDRSHLESLNLEGVTRVLFKTKNSAWWAQDDKIFHSDFIYLTTDGAHCLLEHGVKLVGVDYLSVERLNNPGHPTHHALLKKDVIIIEGLNLSKVSGGDYELIALPLKLMGADGAPTRVVLRSFS